MEPRLIDEEGQRMLRAEHQVDAEAGLEEWYRLLDLHHRTWMETCAAEELTFQHASAGWCEATTAEIEAAVRERWTEEWQAEIRATYRSLGKRGMRRGDAIREAFEAVCRLRSVARVGVLPEVSWP